MAKLATTVTTNTPVLNNLNAASGQINRLLTDLPAFSRSARPAIKSLGQASVTGRTAVKAATPTVADLNRFAKPTPELAQNLAIVLHDLDDPSRAVEPDPRSPGGRASPACRRCWATSSTRRWRSTTTARWATSSASTRSSAACARTTPRRPRSRWRSSSTARSTASATRGSAPTSRASTRPTRRIRARRCPIRAARLPARRDRATSAARLTAADGQRRQRSRDGVEVAAAPPRAPRAPPAPRPRRHPPALAIPAAARPRRSSGSSGSSRRQGRPPPIDLHKTIGQILSVDARRRRQQWRELGRQHRRGSRRPGQAQALLNYLLTP